LNQGSFIQTGSQSWAVGTVFNNSAGTALFGSDTGAGGANLTVKVTGGSVSFASTQHLAGLNISTGALASLTGGGNGHRSMLYTPTLGVAGTLDLTANDLDVQNGGPTALAAITALAGKAFSNGTWTGTGITSSAAAGDSSHLTAIGVILNSTYTTLDGSSVAANDVLAKYTYYGDANLDGHIDGSDYSRIDNGSLSHLTGWFNGDFNYDGVVNGSDYTLIDNAFNTQGAALSSQVASVTTQFAAIPEPTTLMLLTIGAAPLLNRRRCRGSRNRSSF
jgi:hypothetical protein